MRGKPRASPEAKSGKRITPAGAGKTQAFAGRWCTVQDHPRECGENADAAKFCTPSIGSPPRVRGKLVWLSLRERIRRITPASAGKTCSAANPKTMKKDHPRECGENGSVVLG